MPHLAGAACGVCQQPIRGRSDGAFCPECEAPVHRKCAQSPPAAAPPGRCPRCWAPRERGAQHAPPGRCPRCGAPRERGAEWARRVAVSRREKAVSGARHDLRRGLVFLGAGLVMSLLCTWGMVGQQFVLCGLPIMIGVVTVLIAVWQWPRPVKPSQFTETDDYRDVEP
jgi:hypothetical protein